MKIHFYKENEKCVRYLPTFTFRPCRFAYLPLLSPVKLHWETPHNRPYASAHFQEECLFKCFMSQSTIFHHVGTISCFPGLNQYLAADKMTEGLDGGGGGLVFTILTLKI